MKQSQVSLLSFLHIILKLGTNNLCLSFVYVTFIFLFLSLLFVLTAFTCKQIFMLSIIPVLIGVI